MLLATPIWLIALAAISIPVIIHLWNIRPGKTLKVGSIALFNESSAKSSRSFKVQDLLLLILRCALLGLLALILAYPLWQRHLSSTKAKGWVMAPQADFTETYHQFKPQIDSLVKAGYEFHYFGQGFLKQDLNDLQKNKSAVVNEKDTLSYWLLVKQLSAKIGANTKAEIFTPNSIRHFQGDKPQTALDINWHTYTPADSVKTFLSAAWLTPNGNIRAAKGVAKPSGTTFQYTDLQHDKPNADFNITFVNGVPVINLQNSPQVKINADTSTQRMAIYTDKYASDAGYVKAALDAISQLTQRRMIVKQYATTTIPPGQDWIFWLSDKPVEKGISYRTKNFFEYQAWKPVEINSWISNSNSITQGQPKIALYKSIHATANTNTIWTDGFGTPVLSMQPGQTNQYHFYSRFSPSWSDLVWSDEFPKWLMTLTQPVGNETKYDNRAISAELLQPIRVDSIGKNLSPETQSIDLTHLLWLILVLLFITERWLATRNQTTLANG